jgi:hypothetical protein
MAVFGFGVLFVFLRRLYGRIAYWL